MRTGDLGRIFQDGQVIIQEGEIGDCMYVIQEGEVEVIKCEDDREVLLAVLGEGDIFGEMAILEGEERVATVRARGLARVVTVDKKNFLRRVHEDPTLALRLLEVLSNRIREMNAELMKVRTGD